MINPNEKDIGRKVIFIPYGDSGDEGVITSFNENYVFVRYVGNLTSKATLRKHLQWAGDAIKNAFSGTGATGAIR